MLTTYQREFDEREALMLTNVPTWERECDEREALMLTNVPTWEREFGQREVSDTDNVPTGVWWKGGTDADNVPTWDGSLMKRTDLREEVWWKGGTDADNIPTWERESDERKALMLRTHRREFDEREVLMQTTYRRERGSLMKGRYWCRQRTDVREGVWWKGGTDAENVQTGVWWKGGTDADNVPTSERESRMPRLSLSHRTLTPAPLAAPWRTNLHNYCAVYNRLSQTQRASAESCNHQRQLISVDWRHAKRHRRGQHHSSLFSTN